MDVSATSLVEAWEKEQERISSQVSIPESSTYSRLNGDSRDERFRSARPGPSSESRLLRVGGVDVGFSLVDKDRAVATYVVLLYDSALESSEVVHRAHAWYELTVPYLPGYLAFREVEPIMSLVEEQMRANPEVTPDVILVDVSLAMTLRCKVCLPLQFTNDLDEGEWAVASTESGHRDIRRCEEQHTHGRRWQDVLQHRRQSNKESSSRTAGPGLV